MRRKGLSKGKNIVSSFSYPEEFDVVMRELHVIAAREGKEKSELIRDILLDYVNNHKEGNETFKLDEWVADPEFFAVPALDSSNEKWIKYVKECNNKELTKIGTATSYIHGLVKLRRDREHRERLKK